jgi:chromosome segregation ATPase
MNLKIKAALAVASVIIGVALLSTIVFCSIRIMGLESRIKALESELKSQKQINLVAVVGFGQLRNRLDELEELKFDFEYRLDRVERRVSDLENKIN